MLESVKEWLNGGGGETGSSLRAGGPVPVRPGFPVEDDRRQADRFWFAGAEVFLFLPDEQCFRLRLRDVSCEGVCGLTDAPVSVGEMVMVQFEETFMPAAHVTWTRNAWVGLTVVNTMSEARLRRLCERHKSGAAWSPAMRTASDLGTWWTDVDEVRKGRRVRLARR